MRPSPGTRSALLLGTGGLVLVLALLGARMLLGARANLLAAEESCGRRDLVTCSRLLRRAMAYYLPGNPWVGRAAERLRAEASAAEARGERTLALHAWQELRSAVVVTRGLTQPFGALLAESAARIAALQALDPEAAPHLRTPSGRAALVTRLAHPPEPRPLFVVLGLLGFLLFSGGGFALCFRGLRPDATPRPRRFVPLLGAVLLGLGLFALGMGLA